MRANLLLWGLALLLLAACTKEPPGYFQPLEKKHHLADRFRNNYHDFRPEGLPKWWWQRFTQGLPKEPEGGYQPPMAKPQVEALKANQTRRSFTWIGHATVLLQMGGQNFLFDPQFSQRASPFSWAGPARRSPPGLSLEQLPPITAVFISHNHYDHLDRQSLLDLKSTQGEGIVYYVPLGLKAWMQDLGLSPVVELDWWDQVDLGSTRITLAPTQHQSMRKFMWADFNQSLWGAWVLKEGDFQFYFAGDTGYSPDFKDTRAKLGPMQWAAIPIGAYEPRWFMKPQHLNPAEAVQVHLDLESQISFAIHWGAFELTDETITEPPLELSRQLVAQGVEPQSFKILKIGETMWWQD